MQQIRRDFRQWLQDETALRKARMRDFKMFFRNGFIAVQQKVEIHCARPLMKQSDPLERFVFNAEQSGQQRAGVKLC